MKEQLSNGDSPHALRVRTYLKGIIYWNNRRASVECTVRDLSDTGARIELSSFATLPDIIELDIPQKQKIMAARIRRRGDLEIDISFDKQRLPAAAGPAEEHLPERVLRLETELLVIKRLLKRLDVKTSLQTDESI